MIFVEINVEESNYVSTPLYRYEKQLAGFQCDQQHPIVLLAMPISPPLSQYQMILAKNNESSANSCYELGHYVRVMNKTFILPAFCEDPPFAANHFEFLFVIKSIHQRISNNNNQKNYDMLTSRVLLGIKMEAQSKQSECM